MTTKIPDDIMTPETQKNTSGKRVLIVTGDKVEDIEFVYPYYRFIEEGVQVDVATLDGGSFKGKTGYTFPDSKKIDDIHVTDYHMLYLPGGKAPETLRKSEKVLELVQTFASSGRPISSICHGPQILASAGVVGGVKMSGYPEIEKELEAAGAIFTPTETEVSGQFVTARWPADLPMHMKRTLEVLGVQHPQAHGIDNRRMSA